MSFGLRRLWGRARPETVPDERDKYSFIVCPNCGLTYDRPQHYCQRCHFYAAQWWWRSGTAQPRSPWRMRALLIGILLALVLGYLGYEFHPFIPNPLNFFKLPSTRLSAPIGPGTWAEFGLTSAHVRYVPEKALPVGRVRWSLSLGPPTFSSPAVVDGVLYVGAHFRVLALEAATGRQLWESKTTGPVHASPVVAGSRLYLGLLDGRIIALDRMSGRPAWEFQTENFVFSSAVVKDGRLFIGSGDEFLYCLDAETGRVLWRTWIGGRALSAPAVQDGIVYAAADNRNLHSLSARTGARRLMFRMAQDIVESPVVADGLVYFTARDGRLYTIRHGAREWPGQFQMTWLWIQFWLWRLPVPTPPTQAGAAWRFNPKYPRLGFVSPPAVTPEAFYMGDRLGIFYACEAARAKPLWRFRIRSPILESPLVVGDRVYFGAEDGRLYALERQTGQLAWQLDLGAPVMAGPVFGAGLIFVRTKDGMLHAIE
jgi:outer membrane protein assembly factor BamB